MKLTSRRFETSSSRRPVCLSLFVRQEHHSARHRLNIMSVAHGICKAFYMAKDLNTIDHRHVNEMHIVGHTVKIASMIKDTNFLNTAPLRHQLISSAEVDTRGQPAPRIVKANKVSLIGWQENLYLWPLCRLLQTGFNVTIRKIASMYERTKFC